MHNVSCQYIISDSWSMVIQYDNREFVLVPMTKFVCPGWAGPVFSIDLAVGIAVAHCKRYRTHRETVPLFLFLFTCSVVVWTVIFV